MINFPPPPFNPILRKRTCICAVRVQRRQYYRVWKEDWKRTLLREEGRGGGRLGVIENGMKNAARRRCERDRVGGVQYLPKDNRVIITIIIVQPDTHKTIMLTLVYRCDVS